MSDSTSTDYRLVIVATVESDAAGHPLETAARLTEIHPDLLRHYCRSGLLGDAYLNPDAAPEFDDTALYEIRRIEHFRNRHSVNLHALPLVCELAREVERMRAELRFLRSR